MSDQYEEDSDDDADDEVGFYKITIPTIMKLEGDSNLAEWKESVRAYGELLGLTKFIDGTAVQPPLAASTKRHNRFRRKKGTAYLMIRNSVTPVMGIIYSYGWIDGESDRHGLYTTTSCIEPFCSGREGIYKTGRVPVTALRNLCLCHESRGVKKNLGKQWHICRLCRW
ncbi:hypothetical protein BT67DRAFT_433941 [Trichocladium antarcticum]|uniref:Uncharacterized protein n=1 Tax=Trichocladium antarcticum TaxID=1450529 RepID=A0AAN6ZE46_9PEZI|nr:hypothetical protein BT67DRAFT_433941 [Trichocladium antarcticum]